MVKDETKRFNECTNCTDYPFLRTSRLWPLCARTTRGKQQMHKSQIFITMNNSFQGYCAFSFVCVHSSDVCTACDGQMSDSIPKEIVFPVLSE